MGHDAPVLDVLHLPNSAILRSAGAWHGSGGLLAGGTDGQVDLGEIKDPDAYENKKRLKALLVLILGIRYFHLEMHQRPVAGIGDPQTAGAVVGNATGQEQRAVRAAILHTHCLSAGGEGDQAA